jgi:hypothetical protein
MGALPVLYAATKPDAPNGALVGPTPWLGQWCGPPAVVRPYASLPDHDPAIGGHLWSESERLTGHTFSFV